MFWDVRAGGHGLPRNPFLALVAPRPIGWISTRSVAGVPNLAPYSFFNAFASEPPIVAFGSSGPKHSLANVEETGCFVANVVSADLAAAMNATSAKVGPEVDEFALAGLTAVPGTLVDAPRVAEAPAALECRLVRVLPLTGADGQPANGTLVLGEVVGMHIEERVLTDGLVDIAKLRPLARLGYLDYAAVSEGFTMRRPD